MSAGMVMRDLLGIQQGVPHDRHARVVSWAVLISFVALPAGNVLSGPLSARFATADLMTGIAAWMLLAGCRPLLVRGVRGVTRGSGAPATTGEGGGQSSAAIAAS